MAMACRMTGQGRTLLGVGCGVAAGALWGLVFLAPELAADFTPLQLAAGRYLAYGVIAAALLAPRWRSVSSAVGRREWIALSWLSLLGNTLYYVLLASAVQMGGVAMTSVVIGFLPVAVTVIGARDHGAVPLRRLIPSLLLSAAGVICIAWQSMAAAAPGAETRALVGLACAIGALAAWTAYAVWNGRWLARTPHLPRLEPADRARHRRPGACPGHPRRIDRRRRPRPGRLGALYCGFGRGGDLRVHRRQRLLEPRQPAAAGGR